jgi:hypothetical protein
MTALALVLLVPAGAYLVHTLVTFMTTPSRAA